MYADGVDVMSKDLGIVLKYFRMRCELTQQQVADVLHIDRSTYAYYESGATEPDLKSISKISKVFNVPVEYLLPQEDGRMKLSVADPINDDKDKEDFSKGDLPEFIDEKIYSLSKEERGFVAWMRTLTPDQKAKLKNVFEEVD